jgi:DNA-directed RNA polymerase subunit RPC12/RpoP
VKPLDRAELAARVATFKAATRGPRAWGPLVVGIGGLALGLLGITIAERFGWPSVAQPLFFFGGWVIMLGSAGFSTIRTRRLRERYAWDCPSCGIRLLGDPREASRPAGVDQALATGRCPACEAPILTLA